MSDAIKIEGYIPTAITVDNRTFWLFPEPWPKIGFAIWWQDPPSGGNPVMLGIADSPAHRDFLIANYFRFSFCLLIDQEGVHLSTIGDRQPWHIRPLVNGQRFFHPNTINTESICKQVREKNGIDIIAPVNLDHNNICEDCIQAYASQ
ncbi:hypothetical protein LCGC14_1276680 [marine sediment metagenome]|uniref:Uncharacterized protein n=1 Tax=marine sediment metagenome TaxID=412755 RepID=A0A0F9LHP0_9ZZZZ